MDFSYKKHILLFGVSVHEQGASTMILLLTENFF
jgi:hypothetical protein